MNGPIDKIAWIHLEHGKILSTRSRGRNAYYIPGGKRDPGESDLDTLVREIEEIAWLSYADRDRVSPVDQIIFDHLHQTGQLH
ncbi:NUDIX hydrolase [Nonomuraea soli]|uniref:ADP-ribose pyrophosphatase YjhB (NUDIX family) n=1 Tax=Nonomuraea soli TaxID=1032476 RepID=A0A7W0CTZ7_9ACTN|nr:NUDIX domain-containing protein [Nonomuraea soli]MBA2897316.1 ADP-ribose pyrophosphatase YjhB (NUDIX family) [Nonomuraea soli]